MEEKMKKSYFVALILFCLSVNMLISETRNLIIAPGEFMEAGAELADYYAENYGIVRELHGIEEIISGADDAAEALHEYLAEYFAEPGVEPEGSSVLLLGSGTDSWSSGSERNKIPVFIESGFVCDAGFVNLDGFPGAEVAIGRIPAVNNEELTSYLDNFYSYLEGDNPGLWQRKLLFTADDELRNNQIEGAEPNSGLNHSVCSDNLANSINVNYLKRKVYGIDYEIDTSGDKPEARQAIIESLNSGINLWCYTGQGNVLTLGDENYFRQEDIAMLENENQRGFMFTATCNTGNFSYNFECMGELLLFNEEGGIIGGILPSTVTYATSNNVFGCYLLPLLYDEGMYWGEALRISQLESSSSIINGLRYNLLGDPLGKINSGNSYDLILEPEVTILSPGEETLLGWNCGTGYEEVLFGVIEASNYIEYTNTLQGTTYNYNGYRPGEFVFMETTDVIDSRVEVEAILPQETETGEDGKILCYTQNITGISEFWLSGNIQIGESGNNSDEIPSMTKLSNYPNPFNPETTIRYYLPESGIVKLAVYNIKGKLVSNLINNYGNEGWHERVWNGKDAAGRATSSGIYIIRLQSGEYSISHKISQLK
jgi:Peptidase family C25